MLPTPNPFGSFKPPADEDWAALTQDATERLVALEVDSVDQGLAELLLQVSGPQLDFGRRKKLARLAKLAAPHAAHLSPFRKMTVGFVGNATLSFLCAEMAAAGLARSLLVETVEAPFDTAPALAFGVSDGFEGHKLDAIVFYTEAGSLVTSQLLDGQDEARVIRDTFEHISSVAKALRDRFQTPVIVPTLVARPDRLLSSADIVINGTHLRLVQGLNAAMAEAARQDEWVLWDLQALAHDIGLNRWFDPVRFYQSKVPFSLAYAEPVADHLCSLLAAMSGRSRRALVLDLDNTLWGGVIGDDGLHGITLGPGSPAGEAYQAFQAFVLELHRRGVVLAVSSKNEDTIARSVFREHPDMLLREEHISVFQANWTDKASNIRVIAESLKLGLESLVFVDDNPVECALVRRELPQVAVPHMGEEPALFSRVLSHSRLFEHLNLNSDDLLRVKSYRHNAEMAEVRSSTSDYAAYLKSLQMRMEIAPCCDNTHGRITQLINKTNQFNLTTHRYNGEDVRALMHDSDTLVWQARIADKFADYGTIAVLIVRQAGKIWDIDTWLQSCRILERGVEQAMMNALIEHALTVGVERITGHYIQTDRNVMVADLYLRLGFEEYDDQRINEGQAFAIDPKSYETQPSTIEVSLKLEP